jgi:hypothetical protein
MTTTCQLEGCTEPGENHTDHQYNDAAPAKVSGAPGAVYVYGLASDRRELFPDDQIIVGIMPLDDEPDGEAFLTVEEAEHLCVVLQKAIAFIGKRAAA